MELVGSGRYENLMEFLEGAGRLVQKSANINDTPCRSARTFAQCVALEQRLRPEPSLTRSLNNPAALSSTFQVAQFTMEMSSRIVPCGRIPQSTEGIVAMADHGPKPYVVNIEEATLKNEKYRSTVWSGNHLQLTVMSIPVGDDIGLEVHPENDQFLRLEQGRGRVQMGKTEDNLDYDEEVEDDWVIFVPAGMWHNVTNIGDEPMKVYAIYAPPHHPHGTEHPTKQDQG